MSQSPEYPFEFDRPVPECQYEQDTVSEESDADDGTGTEEPDTPFSTRLGNRPAESGHTAGKRPNRKRKRSELYCQKKRKPQKPALKQRFAQLERGISQLEEQFVANATRRDRKRATQASMGETIREEKPRVKWSDIAGLETAKKRLTMATTFPIQHPSLFCGKRRPYRGVLLYGLPGTGKTLLAEAVAHEVGHLAFFPLSVADLTSTRYEESVQRIQALFAAAKEHRPSVIFIDEFDEVCAERKGQGGPGPYRVKHALLRQMEDVDGVIVLAATNVPWTLDRPVLRHFDKRICVQLPAEADRAEVFRLHFEGVQCELTWQDYGWLARRTHNYSGADIAEVCRQALKAPARQLQEATCFRLVLHPHDKRQMYEVCSPNEWGAVRMPFRAASEREYVEPPVTFEDVKDALEYCTAQATKESLRQLKKFEVVLSKTPTYV